MKPSGGCDGGKIVASCYLFLPVCDDRYGQMGRLSGHQAQVMALAVDTDVSQEGHDLVISGSKDHYIKVSALSTHAPAHQGLHTRYTCTDTPWSVHSICPPQYQSQYSDLHNTHDLHFKVSTNYLLFKVRLNVTGSSRSNTKHANLPPLEGLPQLHIATFV